MKNIFLCFALCLSVSAIAQTTITKESGEFTKSLKVGSTNVVTGISNDTGTNNLQKRLDKLITERAAKWYADSAAERAGRKKPLGFRDGFAVDSPNNIVDVDSNWIKGLVGWGGVGSSINLQAVTDNGFVTTHEIVAAAFQTSNTVFSKGIFLIQNPSTSANSPGILLRNSTSPFASVLIQASNITGVSAKVLECPNKSGTIALLDDVALRVYNEETTSSGSTTVTMANPYKTGTIELWRNGVKQSASKWTEATSTTITLTFTPDSGDLLVYNYTKQ